MTKKKILISVFIGIIAKFFSVNQEGKIITKDLPAKKEKIPIIDEKIGLGIAFNALTIMEAIEAFLEKHDKPS